MFPSFKSRLREIALDSFAWNLRQRLKNVQALRAWHRAGRPPPTPHIVKERIVARYAAEHALGAFVETGTLHGDMVYALKDRFRSIVSIELSRELCELAHQRFARYSHIEIIHGDSANML